MRDLDGELLEAASRKARAPLQRGRRLARTLRRRHDDVLATLVEELCDDLDSARRHVKRLGLELHDEGLQDLAALTNDLHLFRAQLIEVVDGMPQAGRIVGRVDDLMARIVHLDAVLRDVTTAAHLAPILTHPLSDLLRAVVDACDGECDVTLDLESGLDSEDLSDGQRIAAVRIVQGALANLLRHSGAANAAVRVRTIDGALHVEVVDDGVGFDVAATLARALETHRFGLLGMRERALLLGGEFAAESCEGGPTRIFARLPR
jgi:signal transduction histidine kinase